MKHKGDAIILADKPCIVTVNEDSRGIFGFKYISWPRYWFIRLTSRLFGGKR